MRRALRSKFGSCPRFAPGSCPRFLALALLCAAPAWAYDPSFRWSTLSTERFEVHFPDGNYRLALKVARAAEAAHAALSPILGIAPGERTHIVISDDADAANGEALTSPRNVMRLYAAAPDAQQSLSSYDDYLWLLVTHEYTHVLHMETVGGAPAAVNRVLGKFLVPNRRQPRWVLEGLAVYEESAVSSAGRVRSSLHDMMLRAEVLSGAEIPLDQLSNLPLTWPRLDSRYLHGGRFMAWIAEQHGDEALMRLSWDYGSRLVPWFLNSAAEAATGESFYSLYERFRASLAERYRAQAEAVLAQGLTAVRALTQSGEDTGHPRWSGGRIVYTRRTGDAWPTLRAVALDGSDQEIARVNSDAPLAADAVTAIVAEPEVYAEFSEYDDLYAVDLAGGEKRRLTEGARITEPDLGPDGRIVAVQRRSGQRTALVLMDLGALSSEKRSPTAASQPARAGALPAQDLYLPPPFVRLANPRFSPDGAFVAFVEHGPVSNDLRLLDLRTGAVRALAESPAQEISPAFSADGKTLWFSSDRTGIFNLYRLALPQGPGGPIGEVCRATNVVDGAFDPQPSPDGAQVAFVTYSARGFDIAVAPSDELACRTVADAPPPPADPLWSEPDTLYPVQPYRPWASLAPRLWLPLVFTDPGDGRSVALGAVTLGEDVVGLHHWNAAAWYGIGSRQAGFDASWTADLAWPSLSISASRDVGRAPVARATYLETATRLGLRASLPFSAVERSQALSLAYTLTWLDPVDRSADPAYLPDAGRVAQLTLGYAFQSAHRFPLSISGEEGRGFSVSASLGARLLGGQFDFAQLGARYTEFVRVPWTDHHALALRLSGAVARGALGRRHFFALGGQQHLPDPLSAALGSLSEQSLRGYPPGAFGGSAFLLGTMEYRFPIADVDRGLWTLPIALRRIHGALFGDAGDAFQAFERRPRIHFGAGAEVRIDLVLDYVSTLQARAGIAQGLSAGGVRQIYYGLGGVF